MFTRTQSSLVLDYEVSSSIFTVGILEQVIALVQCFYVSNKLLTISTKIYLVSGADFYFFSKLPFKQHHSIITYDSKT